MVGSFTDAASGRQASINVNAFGAGEGTLSYTYSWGQYTSPSHRLGPPHRMPTAWNPVPDISSSLRPSDEASVEARANLPWTELNAPRQCNQSVFIKGYSIALRRKPGLIGLCKSSKIVLVEDPQPDTLWGSSSNDNRFRLFRSRSSSESSGSSGRSYKGGSARARWIASYYDQLEVPSPIVELDEFDSSQSDEAPSEDEYVSEFEEVRQTLRQSRTREANLSASIIILPTD